MSPWIPILATAAAVTGTATYAVTVDRLRNPVTGAFVLIAALLPWLALMGLFAGLDVFVAAGVFGSGPLFFGALLRYWLGPRYPNWEKACCAMMAGNFLAVGFFISFFGGLYVE